MALLTALQSARAANPITFAAADAAGDSFANTGREALLVQNNDVGARTVTVVTQATVDGLAVADLQITVPAGELHLIGPFAKGVYDDVNGEVQITYNDATNVNVAVVRIAS